MNMASEVSAPVRVDAMSFVRAESDTYFDSLLAAAGGLGRWHHIRALAPVDNQVIVRMNRDTLYSSVVIDVSAGAELTMPQAGGRYQTAMVVDQDHYITKIYDRPGVHLLAAEEFGTEWVAIAVRTLVDPADPADLTAVAALQDQLAVTARSARAFTHPAWDPDSLAATRRPLLELARGRASMTGAFGSRQQTDPIAHLLGTAAGWGGLPPDRALYLGVEPGLPTGHYSLTVGTVPVRGFWSISVYNRDGFFQPNEHGRYSVNSITAVPNDDGTVTVNFGGDPDLPNQIPVMDGWNYTVRLYQPEPDILGGRWIFPPLDQLR